MAVAVLVDMYLMNLSLREKGYAHTTARDIIATSGTNLASIGYHHGSAKALVNAAVLTAMDDFGQQMAQAIGRDADVGTTTLERVERFWTRVIDWPGRSAHCTRRWSAASWCSG